MRYSTVLLTIKSGTIRSYNSCELLAFLIGGEVRTYIIELEVVATQILLLLQNPQVVDLHCKISKTAYSGSLCQLRCIVLLSTMLCRSNILLKCIHAGIQFGVGFVLCVASADL